MAKEVTDQITDKTVDNNATESTDNKVVTVDQTIDNIDKILKDPKYKEPLPEEDLESEDLESKDTDSTDSEEDVESDKTDTESEVAEATKDSTDTTEVVADEEWEEVNPAVASPFIKAALSANWPVSRIQEYAETHSDEDLMFVTNLLHNQKSDSNVTDVVKDEHKEDQTFKLDDTVLKQVAEDSSEGTANLIKSLATELQNARSEIANIKKEFGDIQSHNQTNNEITQYNVANEMFDSAAKVMPSIGETDKLPKYPNGGLVQTSPEFQVRDKIYTRAANLTKLGMSFRDAMKDSLQWYRGGVVEQELEGNILSKIKKNEKRLSAKGTSKKMTTKYSSERERRSALVNDIARQHGSELPQ